MQTKYKLSLERKASSISAIRERGDTAHRKMKCQARVEYIRMEVGNVN